MKTKKTTGILLMTFAPALFMILGGVGHGAVIIDHNCTNIDVVPQSWTDQAKAAFRIWYGHTSHGSQITAGMENLQNLYGSKYAFNPSGSGGALAYEEVYGDLGGYGDLTWMEMTREQLNRGDNDRNVVMWSWCGGVTDNTEEGIDVYLNAMAALEHDYPGVLFIYMTGHLDGSGEMGNLNIRNNQIRNFCRTNNKILFDFADIESYDPDGDYFLDRSADDGCYYDSGNWAEEWCAEHPGSELCHDCDCQHSHPLNCNLKGRAFWWMMAQMAGWNTSASPTPTPQGSAAPTETPSIGSPTPTPPCYETEVRPYMPRDYYYPGNECFCTATICNNEGYDLYDHHVVIVLEVHGFYFFGPSFGQDLNTYDDEIPVIYCGESSLEVLTSFTWPGGVGSESGIMWYGGILNPAMSNLVGNIGTFGFGWSE